MLRGGCHSPSTRTRGSTGKERKRGTKRKAKFRGDNPYRFREVFFQTKSVFGGTSSHVQGKLASIIRWRNLLTCSGEYFSVKQKHESNLELGLGDV